MSVVSKKTIAFFTLGCKVNFAETNFISNNLPDNFEVVDFSEVADFYVIHSCALTSVAEKKTRNAIYRAYRRNDKAIIFVIGCASNDFKKFFENFENVHFFDNEKKFSLNDVLLSNEFELNHKNNNEFKIAYSLDERTRSFLKIQDGCDNFCSYCIIPYTRGNPRSAKIEEILKVVDNIIKNGFKEIVLTGINIGKFGQENNESLEALLEKIVKIENLHRIRLSSIEPQFVTDKLLDLYAKNKKLMPHFHIPIQSGCDDVLKAMNRKYNSAYIKNLFEKIISLLPEACIAVDVIAGFPSETEENFNTTYDFLSKLPIAYMHVFTYSKRKGTASEKFQYQVDEKTKKHRTKKLIELSRLKKNLFYRRQLNTTHNVLFEAENKNGYIFGWTENYVRVRMPFNKDYVNNIVKVMINEYNDKNDFVEGVVLKNKKTLVIGASLNSFRFSYKAVKMLQDYNYEVLAIGKKEGLIHNVKIDVGFPQYENVHTVTLYLNPENQKVYYDYIIETIKPKRVIFNPGTENYEFINVLNNQGIEVLEACTLVLLSTGRY